MTSTNNQSSLPGAAVNDSAAKLVTRTGKGSDGWESRTDVPLGNSRLLRITTCKSNRGGISTHGTVFKVEDGSMTTELFGDYSKDLAKNAAVRCTEKTVMAQHLAVLDGVEGIKSEVVAFYVAKNPKPWVVVRNAGEDNEDIVDDFAKFGDAVACKNELGEDGACVMRRMADGALTTEY